MTNRFKFFFYMIAIIGYSTLSPVCNGASGVSLYENFDDDRWQNKWHFDRNKSDDGYKDLLKYTWRSPNVYHGEAGRSLKITIYPEGVRGGNGHYGSHFKFHFMSRGIYIESHYFRYVLRFSPDFDVSGGGKIAGFSSMLIDDGIRYGAGGKRCIPQKNCFSARVSFKHIENRPD